MEKSLKEIKKVLNITREDYPVNLLSGNIEEVTSAMARIRTILESAKTNPELFLKYELKDVKYAKAINIFSFFINLALKYQKEKTDLLIPMLISSYVIAKRIEDLEDLLLKIEESILENNIENIENIFNMKIKSYELYTQQVPVILDVFMGHLEKEKLKDVDATEEDLDILEDYLDVINSYQLKINQDLKKDKEDFSKFAKEIMSGNKSVIPTINNYKDLEDNIYNNVKPLVETYLSFENDEQKALNFLSSAKIEYVLLAMSARILELENVLQLVKSEFSNIKKD